MSGYNSKTQEKNIAWFLPRPKPDHYKGGMPLYAEEWLIQLAKDILTKIALQLGSEVSLREIATSLQANWTTVSNYVEIFVKNYILISLPSFKTNARRAVSENKKYYFYDLGLRNALIKDFRDLDLRQDRGAVFENYIVSEIEKIKKSINYNFTKKSIKHSKLKHIKILIV